MTPPVTRSASAMSSRGVLVFAALFGVLGPARVRPV